MDICLLKLASCCCSPSDSTGPVLEGGHPGVGGGIAGETARGSPGSDTMEHAIGNHRATRVTLKSIVCIFHRHLFLVLLPKLAWISLSLTNKLHWSWHNDLMFKLYQCGLHCKIQYPGSQNPRHRRGHLHYSCCPNGQCTQHQWSLGCQHPAGR